MTKRELSSTLRNLKFMQRVAQREEKTKKEEEVTPDGNFPFSSIQKKCMVIMEGDPHPGAIKGRMSFQSFNPSIDKLNEEAANVCQPEASATCSGNQSGSTADREDGSTQDGSESLKLDSFNSDANGDLKRKQAKVVPDIQYPNKAQKNVQGNQVSTPNNIKGSHKQSKREKLDWNVLRPPKCQNKRG
uniref:Putative M-phase phosphoprotein 6 isoform X1 n=1 Tax=Davidia involucrata TaxID=16924 RepID=A0A5B6ZLG4_DAVIN